MNITLTASALPVLIDTWWNVNSHTEPLLPVSRTVLIDTWWNVNSFPLWLSMFGVLVLIDTWWNVNKGMDKPVYQAYKF